jgi:hypothetical protein
VTQVCVGDVMLLQFKLGLPKGLGFMGTTFADVSYVDGTIWIEKLRDQATGNVYHSVYKYEGPTEKSSALDK